MCRSNSSSPTLNLCLLTSLSLCNAIAIHIISLLSSSTGLEFDEQVVRIGQHTKIRVAATLGFPAELPLEEGEQPVRIRVNRLALRTRLI